MLSDHYRLPPKTLTMLGIDIQQQMASFDLFMPAGLSSKDREQHIEKPLGPISLLHYMDNCGIAFMSKPKTKADKIAAAMFDELSSEEKLTVYMYVEYIEG